MAAAMLRQTRTQILLSLNAVAILVAGIVVAGAIWIPKETTFRVVSERTDVSDENVEEVSLLDSVLDSLDFSGGGNANQGGASSGSGSASSGGSTLSGSTYREVVQNAEPATSGNVPAGELWNETSMTIYQSADQDICVDSSLSDLGDMYWQTSNAGVISKFYAQARTRLGYSAERCRYPMIVGTGTTTITAGTYDGTRRDTLTVTVIAIPTEQWKREVLNLVNQERAKAGLGSLTWGSTCESAAQTRAREIMTKYDHSRPDGSSWQTACPIPSTGGTAGENLAAGNTAVSPRTVVATWMASPTHKANILNGKFTKMSVGFVYDASSQYKTYWSQFFSTY